jgi:hypothetical protein
MNPEQNMDIKNLQQGAKARIKSTGQVVEIKRVSNHGFSIVRFKTGGDYMVLNDRLETAVIDQVRH